MQELQDQKDNLQLHYDTTKQAIANGEEEYTENFAAITDGLGIANFATDPMKALSLLREALLIRRDKVCAGKDDESVITSLNNVSILLRKFPNQDAETDKIKEAMDYQRQAVEMFCRLYPDSRHLNAAANLNTLVDTLDEYQLGNEEEKERFLRMAVERFQKSFEEKKKEENAEEKKVEEQKDENNDDATNEQQNKKDDKKEEEEDVDGTDPLMMHYAKTLRRLARSICHDEAKKEEAVRLNAEAAKIDPNYSGLDPNLR